jgi:hypothetical protein
MPFSIKELNYLLRTVRDRINELGLGLHRFYLARRHKSKSKEELFPQMKEEMSLLTAIRTKLWRMKSDVQTQKPTRDERSKDDAE